MAENVKRSTPGLKYRLREIYFYLTKGCNLCCRHCWINPGHQTESRAYPEMKPEHFISAIEQAKPLGLIRAKLTGGEPLLHGRIREILEYLSSANIQVGLETNGVLCTKEMAELISRCEKVFVSVSLDGIEPTVHESIRGVKGCFDATVNGIKNLVNAGIKTQIIMTILNENKNQMEDMVKLAKSLGVESLKFNIMQPTGRGKSLAGLTIEELLKMGAIIEEKYPSKPGFRVVFDYPLAFMPLKKFLDKETKFGLCDVLGAIGLLSDGSWAFCGIGETLPELLMGSIETHPLKEVWENNHIFIQMREGLPEKFEGICGDCILNEMCIGSCIAQNYNRTGSVWGANWFCEAAKENGLFPQYIDRSRDLNEDENKKQILVTERIAELKETNPGLFYKESKPVKKIPSDWLTQLNEALK